MTVDSVSTQKCCNSVSLRMSQPLALTKGSPVMGVYLSEDPRNRDYDSRQLAIIESDAISQSNCDHLYRMKENFVHQAPVVNPSCVSKVRVLDLVVCDRECVSVSFGGLRKCAVSKKRISQRVELLK
jgi:hypothetical protein